MKKLYTIIALVLLGFSQMLSAQPQSMAGKDFWFVSYDNHSSLSSGNDSVVLYIISDTITSGTVDNQFYNFHLDYSVTPGTVTILKIPSTIVETNPTFSNTFSKGIRICSVNDVYTYVQNGACAPDTSANYPAWGTDDCRYYIKSPVVFSRFLSDKIPIPPIRLIERWRFPNYSEEWWFDRNSVCEFSSTYCSSPFSGYCCVTALEDSTVVTFTLFAGYPDYSTHTDSIILNNEESYLIFADGFNNKIVISTNCKPIVCSWPQITGDYFYLGLNPTIHVILAPLMHPQVVEGYDYLCKKLESNRFDKGIHYLKACECDNNSVTIWSDDVNRYMYNEIVTGVDIILAMNQIPSYFNSPYIWDIKKLVRKYDLLTGNHRGFWGSTTSYVNVPYTFLRSTTPVHFHDGNGPFYFIYKESAPGYPHYGVLLDTLGCSKLETRALTVCTQPTDRMVKEWVYPTTRNNVKRKIHYEDAESLEIDTLYADVQIYVHENGLHTTYFNGQLLPAEVFDTFPMTNGDYYVTQMAFYNGEIPEIIRITNENGFSAYVDEFGYNVLPAPSGHPEIDDITKVYYYHAGASGCYYTDYPDNGIGLSPHNCDTVYRCLGDTLSLQVEHNPDSVPVEWIVDGVSHLTDTYSVLLAALDTLAVQCVLHYDCPDTTTTFVAVVPPPVITIAHDTTVCAGATLSVEQPNVLSYLWSNGATTPSIAVDSAGTFQVAVTNIGCRAESDSFQVSLYGQSSVDFGDDSLLCELATLLLDATQQHPAQYYWQDASTNTTYTVYEDGDYWVVITDHCLGASDTINIGYLNDFTVNLGPDTTLCEGKTLTLVAETPYCDYLWQDGSTQPTYVVRGPGTYSVEVGNKCFSHWDAVNVDYEHCAQELYLPNAFTPNDDSENPVFLPIFSYPDEIEEYWMEIYNRWGTLVFRTEEKSFGWDGANATAGVYAVVVHYKSRGEKPKTVTGSVTVVR